MVSRGKTLLVCGTKPTPLATSWWALAPVMSSPAQRDRAAADVDHAEHRLEQRRLAGAVRADDADQLALGAVQVAAVEDVDARARSRRPRRRRARARPRRRPGAAARALRRRLLAVGLGLGLGLAQRGWS